MPRKASQKKLIDQLIENNLVLQKKSTELLLSMNELNKNMTRLVMIFEKAAKQIERGEVEEPLAKKLEALLEQNKTIAKGLILLERYVKDKTSTGFSTSINKEL